MGQEEWHKGDYYGNVFTRESKGCLYYGSISKALGAALKAQRHAVS